MHNDNLNVPKKSAGDYAHTIAKAGLSSVPVFGGPAVELFQNVIQPPLGKRLNEWMRQVGEKLQFLEKQGQKLEDLQNNEVFISAVMHASQLALRTHKKEKLDALRNAVINIAKGQAPEEAIQHIYLDFVDSLTELHLRILKVIQSPSAPKGEIGSLSGVIEYNIPELGDKRELLNLLWKDLLSRDLVGGDSLDAVMIGNRWREKHTTKFGDEFLNFISESH
ncbi:MAG: hypothetical protein JW715_05255 [Sedimentisphaerales bacterium]|nr:hypothetical protein [Sedimentisphaerales bacterium]